MSVLVFYLLLYCILDLEKMIGQKKIYDYANLPMLDPSSSSSYSKRWKVLSKNYAQKLSQIFKTTFKPNLTWIFLSVIVKRKDPVCHGAPCMLQGDETPKFALHSYCSKVHHIQNLINANRAIMYVAISHRRHMKQFSRIHAKR